MKLFKKRKKKPTVSIKKDKEKKETKPKDFLKIIVAGEGGVGKTTFLHRYVEEKFIPDTKLTVGVQFFLKEIKIDRRAYKLQLWDLGGEIQFRSILQYYLNGAYGALLMFDLTRMTTLNRIEEWVKMIRDEDPNLPILLLGTKLDLGEKISVDDIYPLELRDKYNLDDYLKVSSKTGIKINEPFDILTRRILKQERFLKTKAEGVSLTGN